jgi:hypothetical protein
MERTWNWEADWNGDKQKQRRSANSQGGSHGEQSNNDLQYGSGPQQNQGQPDHDQPSGAITARRRARYGLAQQSLALFPGLSGGEHHAITAELSAADSASAAPPQADGNPIPQRPALAIE